MRLTFEASADLAEMAEELRRLRLFDSAAVPARRSRHSSR